MHTHFISDNIAAREDCGDSAPSRVADTHRYATPLHECDSLFRDISLPTLHSFPNSPSPHNCNATQTSSGCASRSLWRTSSSQTTGRRTTLTWDLSLRAKLEISFWAWKSHLLQCRYISTVMFFRTSGLTVTGRKSQLLLNIVHRIDPSFLLNNQYNRDSKLRKWRSKPGSSPS